MADELADIPPTWPRDLIHGVRATEDHWLDVYNLALAGTRTAITAITAAEGYADPAEMSMDVLRESPRDWPPMMMSGFLSTVWQGGMIRIGAQVGRGADPYPTRLPDEATRQRFLRAADRELLLEQVRRTVAGDAPSRLSSIWLAEDSPSGRNAVSEMLGWRSLVSRVVVTSGRRFARCDPAWLEDVVAGRAPEDAAQSYWRGEPKDPEAPSWEYLLDGSICIVDGDDLRRLRTFAAKNAPDDFEGLVSTWGASQ